MNLIKNIQVTFDKDEHTYRNNDGKLLSGITSMLHRQLFGDMYSGIPQSVLDRAAEHGSKIHTAIEFADGFGITPDIQEVKRYVELRESYGYKPVDNEYLVSNNVSHASCIDCVWEDADGAPVLVDVKTTSRIYDDYLAWQLSAYAYLFEMQNPGLMVSKLFCAWLPKERYGKPELKEIIRIPDAEVAKLIAEDALGKTYTPPNQLVRAVKNDGAITGYADVVEELVAALRLIRETEQHSKELKATMEDAMREHCVKKWENDRLSITLKADTEKDTFDTKRFRQDYPDLYERYIKKTLVKGGILFKLK